jgi:hypothetical protein
LNCQANGFRSWLGIDPVLLDHGGSLNALNALITQRIAAEWRGAVHVKADAKGVFQIIARILIRCFWLNAALLLIWAALFLAAGDAVYTLHSKLLGIARQEFNLVWYGGMAFLKIVNIVFFLFPYLAIRWFFSRR